MCSNCVKQAVALVGLDPTLTLRADVLCDMLDEYRTAVLVPCEADPQAPQAPRDAVRKALAALDGFRQAMNEMDIAVRAWLDPNGTAVPSMPTPNQRGPIGFLPN